jgi:hypothetical protein
MMGIVFLRLEIIYFQSNKSAPARNKKADKKEPLLISNNSGSNSEVETTR